jgi:hypothetical protein
VEFAHAGEFAHASQGARHRRLSVQQIWQARGLEPHRLKRFKLSRDPNFTVKLVDIVSLYLNPSAKALVLSVDEKSQIQVLDAASRGCQ